MTNSSDLTIMDDVWLYDALTNSFKELRPTTSTPGGRGWHSAVVVSQLRFWRMIKENGKEKEKEKGKKRIRR